MRARALWGALWLGSALGFGIAPAHAQAERTTPVPTVAVQLGERPSLFAQGQAALYRGMVDERGIAFVIPGLTINTAAAIVLESSDPAARLTLRLKNDFSPGWDRTLSSDTAGVIDARFRTEGPAVALVSSDGGMKPYRLAVWVGPELKPHTLAPPPFVSPEAYERLHGGGWKRPAAVAGLALLLLGIGLALFRRRSRA